MSDWQTRLPPKDPYDPAGTSDDAVAAHVAQANPHAQYLQSVVAGAGISINVADPQNPVITGTGAGAGYLDPSTHLVDPLYDFLGKPPTSATAEDGASYPWRAFFVLADGAISAVDGGAAAPGVWRLTNGAANGTAAVLILGTANPLALGGGAMVLPFRFRVPTLSSATNRLDFAIGLHDNWSGAATDQLTLRYSDGTNAGRLTARTTAAGVTNNYNGTTAVAANTWISGRIEINAAGTQADIYINGAATPEFTITSGLPTAAMTLGASNYTTFRSAGGPLSVDLDYLGPPQITFTTPR